MHDASERRTTTPEIEDFLTGGPPPLVFAPGSAAATLKDFFRESAEARRMGGHRAVLITNFSEQWPTDLRLECATSLVYLSARSCRHVRHWCIRVDTPPSRFQTAPQVFEHTPCHWASGRAIMPAPAEAVPARVHARSE